MGLRGIRWQIPAFVAVKLDRCRAQTPNCVSPTMPVCALAWFSALAANLPTSPTQAAVNDDPPTEPTSTMPPQRLVASIAEVIRKRNTGLGNSDDIDGPTERGPKHRLSTIVPSEFIPGNVIPGNVIPGDRVPGLI